MKSCRKDDHRELFIFFSQKIGFRYQLEYARLGLHMLSPMLARMFLALQSVDAQRTADEDQLYRELATLARTERVRRSSFEAGAIVSLDLSDVAEDTNRQLQAAGIPINSGPISLPNVTGCSGTDPYCKARKP